MSVSPAALSAATAALSTSYQTFTLTPYPKDSILEAVSLTIAGASTTGQVATVYISTDSAGDEGITDVVPASLHYGATTATDAWVVYDFGRVLPGVPSGSVYVHVKLSTGTATGCVPTLTTRPVVR